MANEGRGNRSNKVGNLYRFSYTLRSIFTVHELAGPLASTVMLFIVSSLISPQFLTFYNQRVLLIMFLPLALLALGEAPIIIMGSIDLSPGSIMGLVAVVIAYLIVFMKIPIVIATLLGIGLGTLIGCLNGVLVTKAKLPSFVVTLATLLAGRGMIFILTAGYSILGPELNKFGVLLEDFLMIPRIIWSLIPIAIIYYFLLRSSSLGMLVYAIGGNEDAVRLSGLNADRIKIAIFSLAGLFYSLSGLAVLGQLRSGYSYIGYGYELNAIASCVLGGISLAGGIGSPFSPLIGAYLLTLVSNLLVLLGINPFYQWVVTGAILVVAGIALTRGIRYAK